jgi:uncharacterized protein (TIGR03437 family)
MLWRFCCVAVVGAMALPAVSSGQVIQWARQFGTNRVEEALAVATGPNAVYIAGYTFGAFSGSSNAGGHDIFVSKYDNAGNQVWTRQFGSSSSDDATGLAADASGVYVVGRTDDALSGQANLGSTDAFVRKYDADGNELWTRQFGTNAPDEALGAAVDATGVYVAGRTAGALPGQTSGSLGQDDGFLRKYDLNGSELWTRQFGTSSSDRIYGVAADTSGVYVAGYTLGPLVSAAAGTDGFLRKYDSNGTAVWTRQIASAGTGNDIAYAVAVNSSGVYVSGNTTGTFTGQAKIGGLFDAWIRKYDLNGNEQWTRQFGTTDDDYGYGIAVAQRWVYVALSSGWRVLLQRFDLDGNAQGTVETPTDRNFGYGVATDGAAAYLAGSKDGPSLGQTPQGDLDALLIKIPHPPILNGVSDAFTGQAGVSSTTWTALYGENFSSALRTWDGAIQGIQLPTVLDGVSVSINGRAATMYFISPGQINVVAPLDDTSGNVQVTVTTPYGTSPPVQVRKTAYLPAFYAPFGEAKGLSVTAVAQDGSLLGKSTLDPRVARAVRPGEVVQFFASGFGPTNPAVPSDQIFAGAPAVVTPPRITLGGKDAALLGTGNLVGPGLYQFNVTIPDVDDGDQPIVAEVGGMRSSSTVFLSVRK